MPLDTSNVGSYEEQSPTLLSKQPVTDIRPEGKASKDWAFVCQRLQTRLNAMRSWRWSWWSYWAEVAQYTLPRRYHWLIVPNNFNRGNPINDSIVDSTAAQAVNVCASGLWTGLTSPSRPWFDLKIGLPWVQLDAAGAAWLYDTKQRLYTVLGNSNFYEAMRTCFEDVTTFGTGVVIIYPDAEKIIRCYTPCAGEYYLSVGSTLTVDTMYREYNLNVLGIIEQFQAANCPEEVLSLWRSGSTEQEFTIAHAIEPNFAMATAGGEQVSLVSGRYTYREIYWLKDKQTAKPLSVKGFHEKPFFAARWSTVSNDAYGRSPGMDALGDNKQLQLETRRKAEFLEKGVRPPMGADVSLKNQPSSVRPGDITYVSTENQKKGFWPLFEVSPQWLAPMTADLKDVQARIDRAFFVDVFMAISRMEGVQPRNEKELSLRELERLQVLGPFVSQFGVECGDTSLNRVMEIMTRKNMILPKPPSLQNVPIKITYRTMMTIAQEAAETVSMERVFATGGSLSEAAKAGGLPDPLRILNLDVAMRHYAELTNFPQIAMYSEKDVAAMDKVKAQAAQQQQQAAAMAQTTLPAVQAAQGLSKTDVGGGQNALQLLLGGGGQGGPG